MLLDFKTLYNKYNLNIKGVIHIGAHYGQEYKIYEKYNIINIIFFEPLPHIYNILKNNIGEKDNIIFVNKALGNETKKVEMYVEQVNKGQSSSILEPYIHLQQYPHIVFNEKILVDMIKLNDYPFDINKYNFINIDVQGYELEVFKGATKIFDNIDYIMTEVNRDEVYKNCVRINKLDDFLHNYNFERVEVTWDGKTWGDAFYIKSK